MYQSFRFLFKEELVYIYVHLLYELFSLHELSYRKLPPDNYEITQLHTVKVYSIVDYCKRIERRERYTLLLFKCDYK